MAGSSLALMSGAAGHSVSRPLLRYLLAVLTVIASLKLILD
jgi:hypothetical protein